MSLSKQQINDIENVLKSALRHKFENYKPEPASGNAISFKITWKR